MLETTTEDNDWFSRQVAILNEYSQPDYLDERSITEVTAMTSRDHRNHFFAGIGGWPNAIETRGMARRTAWRGLSRSSRSSSATTTKDMPGNAILARSRIYSSPSDSLQVVFGYKFRKPDGREWLPSMFALTWSH